MITLNENDLNMMTNRTNYVTNELFENYDEVVGTLAPDSDECSVFKDGDNPADFNPYAFWFEYQSSSLVFKYHPKDDKIATLRQVIDWRTKLDAMFLVAIENLIYAGVPGVDSEFWSKLAKYCFINVVEEAGGLDIHVMFKQTIFDLDHTGIIALLNAMQGIIFIADHLIDKLVSEVDISTQHLK